jgi:hypothetical protein
MARDGNEARKIGAGYSKPREKSEKRIWREIGKENLCLKIEKKREWKIEE